MTTLMLRRKISSPGLRPWGQKQHRGWRLWLRAYRRLDHCVMENVAITRLAVHCTQRTKRQPPHVVHQYEHCSPAPKYCVCLTKPDHYWIYCTVQTNGRTTKIFAPPPPPPPRERGDEAAPAPPPGHGSEMLRRLKWRTISPTREESCRRHECIWLISQWSNWSLSLLWETKSRTVGYNLFPWNEIQMAKSQSRSRLEIDI